MLAGANAGEERERPMLERVQDAPAHSLALRASGTVMAQDVEAAIEAALGRSEAATGLVIVIDPDFDGYFAELARGLTTASLAHRALVRLAVVTDPERMDEARLSGFDARSRWVVGRGRRERRAELRRRFPSGCSPRPTRKAR